MKKSLLAVFIVGTCVASSQASSAGQSLEFVQIPSDLRVEIAKENEMKVDDVHSYAMGTLSWGGGFISAVTFEDSVKNCSIYVSNGKVLSSLFSGAPCEFVGKPRVESSRKVTSPDVLYDIRLFSPTSGAMADDVIALFYDLEKQTYCVSQSLGSWYQVGNKEIPADLSDGRCFSEGAGY
ncbi:hypothetical protein HU755_04170 [Pseudomonas sp. SWRI111]|uniref:hypothetical protein n=1 Tax=Pseudomonas sp. SWRI111 TaxID=2745507 RepID=UPI0016472C7F|nr:hypothetical protein [Pseudomonas sp. SWRI111]MBC3205969.1 hypothetical protein [Pseudomonas sp. SWRI111]